MKGFVTAAAVLIPVAGVLASYTQNFDDVSNMPGWAIRNQSSPLGSTSWFQGSTVFASQSGAANSYIAANYNNVTGDNTISDWLFAPADTVANDSIISFWTRTYENPAVFADRLQVRLSTNGASTDVGSSATDVGDFATLLLDINPTLTLTGYPGDWTQYNLTLSGIPTPVTGRIAFRYFVTNGGSGTNSYVVGIDSVSYTAVPEPTSLGGMALAAGTLLCRRRRAQIA